MSQRDHPGEQPIPADSYAAWWAQAYQAEDPEVLQLREQLKQQYQDAGIETERKRAEETA